MAFSRRAPSFLRVRVPASTSNVGPGFDALGIALDLHLVVAWKAAERTRVERRGAIAESVLPVGSDPVLRGMRRAAILAGAELPPGEIAVEASFPPARGLGASGAGLAAGLLLGNRLTGGKIQREALLEEAIALEGHPENAAAAFLGGAHWSAPGADGHWIHLPVALHKELRFLVVIPPYPLSTERAREVLPASVPFPRAAAQARRVPLLLAGLRTLDPALLRAGIADDLHVPARLPLLAGAASMLEFANQAGALATTISGAGSALLVLTRARDADTLQARLEARVRRLWGEAGAVARTRVYSDGAEFR